MTVFGSNLSSFIFHLLSSSSPHPHDDQETIHPRPSNPPRGADLVLVEKKANATGRNPDRGRHLRSQTYALARRGRGRWPSLSPFSLVFLPWPR